MGEEAIDLEEDLRDLADTGSDAGEAVGKALRPLARHRGTVATVPGVADLAGDGPGVERL
ncbi:hypothetical protein [Nocardiopsis alkaliphila]|uniref:hypothetical protein n=1 Tax=Nocardiopsis alkaliphila TaxID=225762 RepID=UPI00034B4762